MLALGLFQIKVSIFTQNIIYSPFKKYDFFWHLKNFILKLKFPISLYFLSMQSNIEREIEKISRDIF